MLGFTYMHPGPRDVRFSLSRAGARSSAGTVQGTQGSCTFTTNATVDAVFNGDAMQGTVTYTRVPSNGSSGCAAIVGCQSVQNFSGTRPPSAG
jgi:hypothetical protein